LIGTAAAIAAAGLAGYASLIERTALRLNRMELAYKHLPAGFDGFRIIHISDTHLSHWWQGERRMEELVRSNPADILLWTGDIAINSRGARLVREFLGRVTPEMGAWAVWGNTEHKGEYGRERQRDLTCPELHVLTNEHVTLERGGDRIVLAGVDDPFLRHDDIEQAMNGVPRDTFKILMAHAPSIAGKAADAGVDLLLSGHTHGGQIRLPVVGCVYPHIHDYKALVKGLFEGERLSKVLGRDAGEMRVFTNVGVGISNIPMRFLCPPEVAYITLRKA
jgi:predicted MPP superfamily phosphohydrolase